MKERITILKNADLIQTVKKKGNTLSYWYSYTAVFSGSYIYFYSAEDADLI